MSDRSTGSRAGWFPKLRPARGPVRSKIGIVTDSSACLSGAWLESENFQVLSIPVIVNEVIHQDDPQALLMGLAMGQAVRTSRPSPGYFMRAYRQLAASGCEQIISVHMSSSLSGTYESARLASGEVEVPVTVVDSRTVALPLGFAVRRMLTRRAAGATFEELLDIARAAEDNAVFFAVPSLEQLRRGGRISALSGVLGNLLSVKPILSISSGAIQAVEKPRTFPRALARLVALARQAAEDSETTVDVGVMHFGALETAEELSVELAELSSEPVVFEDLPAVLAAHTGIGVIAVCIAPHYPQVVASP